MSEIISSQEEKIEELQKKIAFLTSLICLSAIEECECEKCWKSKAIDELRNGNMLMDWQMDRIRQEVNREWKQVLKARFNEYS